MPDRSNSFAHGYTFLHSWSGPMTLVIGLLHGATLLSNYASPSSGEAYRDRRLTINFELWAEIFCVPTCFHMRIPNPCLSVRLSVCPHPEKRNHHSFVNMSPTLVIDTSMERSSRVLHHGNLKIWFFFSKKFEIRILTNSWNHLSFVNMSPTLVIDTSMERSSRVLHHGNSKIWFIFQKSSKFEFWLLTKSWNHLSFVNMSPTLVIDPSMERSSRVLHHGNPKIWFFFSKKFEIRILTKSWNHLSFVNISPTLVIDTSMERFSLVLHHGNPKILFFWKKFEIWILIFDTLVSSISVLH